MENIIKNENYKDKEWLYQKYVIEKLSLRGIGRLCGTCHTEILYWIDKFCIEKNERNYNYDCCNHYNEWIEMYNQGIGSITIAKQFNCSPTHVRRILTKNNIKFREASEYRKFNDVKIDYFHIIDSEDKAYWLGFICADGYVNAEKHILSIGLTIKDKNHLEKFANTINYNNIKDYYRNSKITSSRLALTSYEMTNDLKQYGLYEAKTFSLTYPENIPKKYRNAFIRGVFDGDGCIYIQDKKTYITPRFEIIGYKDFIFRLQEIICEETGLPFTKLEKTQSNDIVRMRYAGHRRCKIIKDWLYKDATVWMDRKRDKFNLVKNN